MARERHPEKEVFVEDREMYEYPLTLRIAIFDLGAKMRVIDARQETVAFVKQRAFRLKEDVSVYDSEKQEKLLYRIRADRIMDISATYEITDAQERTVGALIRRGRKSLWRTSYDISGANGENLAKIRETNPWVTLVTGIVGAIPVVGPFIEPLVDIILNPTYELTVVGGGRTLIKKRPTFLEDRFIIGANVSDDEVLLPAAIMAVLMERNSG